MSVISIAEISKCDRSKGIHSEPVCYQTGHVMGPNVLLGEPKSPQIFGFNFERKTNVFFIEISPESFLTWGIIIPFLFLREIKGVQRAE